MDDNIPWPTSMTVTSLGEHPQWGHRKRISVRDRMGNFVGTRSIAEAKVVQHHIGDR